jgi:hypothetical protein
MDVREKAVFQGHRHPWELSRAARVLELLSEVGPFRQIADIGAGDLYFAHVLAAATHGLVYAVEPGHDGAADQANVTVYRDVCELPAASVDCAILMDVLEHVADEQSFLSDLRRCLAHRGLAVVTVPAHPTLWSEHDVRLGHRRRYTSATLCSVLSRAGFDVNESFELYSLGVLARVMEKCGTIRGFGDSHPPVVARWPYSGKHLFTRLGRLLLDWDFRANRRLARMAGISFGLSCCAVCRKASA